MPSFPAFAPCRLKPPKTLFIAAPNLRTWTKGVLIEKKIPVPTRTTSMIGPQRIPFNVPTKLSSASIVVSFHGGEIIRQAVGAITDRT